MTLAHFEQISVQQMRRHVWVSCSLYNTFMYLNPNPPSDLGSAPLQGGSSREWGGTRDWVPVQAWETCTLLIFRRPACIMSHHHRVGISCTSCPSVTQIEASQSALSFTLVPHASVVSSPENRLLRIQFDGSWEFWFRTSQHLVLTKWMNCAKSLF